MPDMIWEQREFLLQIFSQPPAEKMVQSDSSVYKMPFAVRKTLGEIRFFDGNFGTDKEFVENKGSFPL